MERMIFLNNKNALPAAGLKISVSYRHVSYPSLAELTIQLAHRADFILRLTASGKHFELLLSGK